MKIKTGIAGALLALFAVVATAQSFPSKPVRILVGFGAGGSTDIVARTLAQSLTGDW
jgi:tripartite-type tricarboxylate transporter receptor subunit TctC